MNSIASSTKGQETVSSPGPVRPAWLQGLCKMIGEQPEARWGTQLIRIAQDMILVCDEDLHIHFHNQAFVKRLGYREGSYIGCNLIDFIPKADQPDARKAFNHLGAARVWGIRVEAKFLTRKAPLAFVAEVTRSRRSDGSYFYYLIARPKVVTASSSVDNFSRPPAEESTAMDWVKHLPVAAWQSDREHRIVALSGKLWSELEVDEKSAVGCQLSVASPDGIPGILAAVKPSLRSALRHSEAEFDFEGKKYQIVVEPVKAASGEFSGSVGYVSAALSVSRPGKDSAPVAGTRTTTVLVNQNSTNRVAESAPIALEKTSRSEMPAKSVTTITECAAAGDEPSTLKKTARVDLMPLPMSPPPRPSLRSARVETTTIPTVGKNSSDDLALPG